MLFVHGRSGGLSSMPIKVCPMLRIGGGTLLVSLTCIRSPSTRQYVSTGHTDHHHTPTDTSPAITPYIDHPGQDVAALGTKGPLAPE